MLGCWVLHLEFNKNIALYLINTQFVFTTVATSFSALVLADSMAERSSELGLVSDILQ